MAWRRFSTALLALALVAWVSIGAIGHLYLKRSLNIADWSYFKTVTLPLKWKEFQTARGNAFIAKARQEMEQLQYREAFENLRRGILLTPANQDGRLLLAQFYIMQGRPAKAQETLLSGLRLDDRTSDYINSVFTFLFAFQMDAEAIELSRQLLARNGYGDDSIRMMLATALATGLYHQGHYAEARKTLADHRLGITRGGMLLDLRIEWESGNKELALAQLLNIGQQQPADEEAYGMLSEYLREARRESELRRVCLLRQLTLPQDPGARIDLLKLQLKAANPAPAAATVDEYFQDFADNPAALLAIANLAAQYARPALAQRAQEHCKLVDPTKWEEVAVKTIEARIAAGEYRDGQESIRELRKLHPAAAERQAAALNGLQAVASVGLGENEAARMSLDLLLEQEFPRPDLLLPVAQKLLALGAIPEARLVFARTVNVDPLNRDALTELIRIDLAASRTELIPPNVERLVMLRRPPRDLLLKLYREFASDRHLFDPSRREILAILRVKLETQPTA